MIRLLCIDPDGSAFFKDGLLLKHIRAPWTRAYNVTEDEMGRAINHDLDWTGGPMTFGTLEAMIAHLKQHAVQNAPKPDPDGLRNLLLRGQQDIRDRMAALEARLAKLEARP